MANAASHDFAMTITPTLVFLWDKTEQLFFKQNFAPSPISDKQSLYSLVILTTKNFLPVFTSVENEPPREAPLDKTTEIIGLTATHETARLTYFRQTRAR
jgi:hypothetical protein